jgi:hypothetical protein
MKYYIWKISFVLKTHLLCNYMKKDISFFIIGNNKNLKFDEVINKLRI